jgi:hypothetical protein
MGGKVMSFITKDLLKQSPLVGCEACKYSDGHCSGLLDATETCGMFDFRDNPTRPSELLKANKNNRCVKDLWDMK